MTAALGTPASGTQPPLTPEHPNSDVRGNPGAHDLLVARLLAELDRPRWRETTLVRACDARAAIEGVLYGGRL